jgi:hypothetical protein
MRVPRQVRIATEYEKGGAACMSVLTDEKFFQGSFDNLKLIRNAGVNVRAALFTPLTASTCSLPAAAACGAPRLAQPG